MTAPSISTRPPRIRPKRAKTAGHVLRDYDDGTIGVVRCPDGDEVSFFLHAAEMFSSADVDAEEGWLIQPPRWRWFRINPDFTGEYSWLIDEPSGPGPGDWRGSYVRIARSSEEPPDSVA